MGDDGDGDGDGDGEREHEREEGKGEDARCLAARDVQKSPLEGACLLEALANSWTSSRRW